MQLFSHIMRISESNITITLLPDLWVHSLFIVIEDAQLSCTLSGSKNDLNILHLFFCSSYMQIRGTIWGHRTVTGSKKLSWSIQSVTGTAGQSCVTFEELKAWEFPTFTNSLTNYNNFHKSRLHNLLFFSSNTWVKHSWKLRIRSFRIDYWIRWTT